jgi:drug/metabolite transporter (DMT)-like permease
MPVVYGGELAALAGAFLWAVASVIYDRLGRQIPPLELNKVKGLLALAMPALTLLLMGDSPLEIEPLAQGLLILSGAVGLGWGDTGFFQAQSTLGARRTLFLCLLALPMAVLMALAFLGETLTAGAWLGILVTVVGVAWVITERDPSSSGTVAHLWRGVGFGLLAALTQAISAAWDSTALTQTDVSPLWGATLRLSAGLVVVAIWLGAARQPISGCMRSGAPQGLWPRVLAAVFAGTYLAVWLQQVALKLASAGVAQTLMSTSHLWILPWVAWRGQRVSGRAIAGAVVALAGIGLLLGLA